MVKKNRKKGLDEQLNELENIFSDLLLDLDEIREKETEDHRAGRRSSGHRSPELRSLVTGASKIKK